MYLFYFCKNVHSSFVHFFIIGVNDYCVATIGVVYFLCVNFGWRTFVMHKVTRRGYGERNFMITSKVDFKTITDKIANSNLKEKGKNVKNNMVDYNKSYKLYKKLPFFNFIAIVALSLIWGIIDALEYITDFVDSEFGCIILWLAIGLVLGFIVMFFTSISISHNVIRTDATVEMLEIAKKGEHSSNINSFASSNDLPEL